MINFVDLFKDYYIEVLGMKRFFKSSLSLILAITIIFSSAYVGLSEIDFGGILAVAADTS